MAASVFDSPLYAKLFSAGEVGKLFTDTAELRAMMLVEGALAKVQGTLGVIPDLSAAAIHRATMEIQLDPGALAQATGQNGVSVPGMVAAFRDEMKAPEHAAFVHWGATSQDIIDTGLMLRLRQALALLETDLKTILSAMAAQATTHATTPMPARTYGQHATPTSWGAVIATWGAPLLEAVQELPALRASSLWVSLSGAAGTADALGPKAPETRAGLADALNLHDPQRSWHTDRTPLLRIVDWMMRVMASLGAMGHSLLALSATGINEIVSTGAGSSSTMPQKQNPVGASALVALSHQATGLRAILQTAAQHQHQRDGAAWFTEWLVLPQLVLGTAGAVQHAKTLVQGMSPDAQRMADAFDAMGLIHAEAISFALCEHMPRPKAQALVKELCQEAQATGRSLQDLVSSRQEGLDPALFDPAQSLGHAPAEARAFVTKVMAL